METRDGSKDRHIKHRENTFLSIKCIRIMWILFNFFLKLGIDGGQEKICTSVPSATYVSCTEAGN
jgi:hypothetical protein